MCALSLQIYTANVGLLSQTPQVRDSLPVGRRGVLFAVTRVKKLKM